MSFFTVSIISFATSFFLSYLLTFPTIALAKRTGLVTDKRKRKHPAHTHTGIIPRGGGIPVFLSMLTTSLSFIKVNKIPADFSSLD